MPLLFSVGGDLKISLEDLIDPAMKSEQQIEH
jgi:hypothetical protein